MLVTRTEAAKASPARTSASTVSPSRRNVVYDRPKPNGRTGVGSALVMSVAPPRIGCRYEYG